METSGLGRAFGGLDIASSGLSAQRLRIETIARNIANAETTETAEGTPYRRQLVRLAEVPFQERLQAADPSAPSASGGVRVEGVEEDPTEGPLVYDPGHPAADEAGYVRMPNVQISREMTDLMEARRLYEANASVFEAVKAMLGRAAKI